MNTDSFIYVNLGQTVWYFIIIDYINITRASPWFLFHVETNKCTVFKQNKFLL